MNTLLLQNQNMCISDHGIILHGNKDNDDCSQIKLINSNEIVFLKIGNQTTSGDPLF